VQGYERVLPYVLEDEPMSILLKALIDKGFGVVQLTQINEVGWHRFTALFTFMEYKIVSACFSVMHLNWVLVASKMLLGSEQDAPG
jgi:hypothetical protein